MRKQIYSDQPAPSSYDSKEITPASTKHEKDARYHYTDADLGEDILELSAAHIPAHAHQFPENIYSIN